jgi:hypothetical protein
MRNYDNETLAELEPLYEHLDAILDRHKMLIPGGLNASMRTWHSVVWEAIQAKSDRKAVAQAEADETRGEPQPEDRYTEIAVVPDRDS